MLAVAGEAAGVGEARARLEALWDLHAIDVRRVLGAFGLSGDRLDEALQDTFARLGAALARLDPTRPARAFLLGIARHVAVDATARARRTEGLGARDPIGRESTEGRAERRELRGLVRTSLAELEPELRTALLLRHVGGLTMEELAEALECSVPTARARLAAAGHLLAGELRRRGVVP